jgi:hypothetical protein
VGIQRPSTLVVIDVTVPNSFPHEPHLESYPHHRGSLDVVGLGEGRPPAAGTDVPDNGLDPMVAMVPVRGGRVAPPMKAAISVNPVVDASVPVWAVAAVGGTAAARHHSEHRRRVRAHQGYRHGTPGGARLPTALPAPALPPSPA